jgi:hypothetical protein
MARPVRSLGATALLATGLLVAACSGSTSSASPGSTGAPPSASAPAPTEAPSPAASASSAGEASAAPSIGAFPSFDVSSILGGLAKVDSYHMTITVDGEQVYDAVVVTKPVAARSMTLSGGTKIVIVGDKAWLSQDGTTFQSVPQAMVNPMVGAFDPALMMGAFGGVGWAQSSTDQGEEQKNGVSAHHYHIDASSPIATFTSFPPDGTIDVWIANDGYLVAVETKGFTGDKDVQIEVANVNDPANKVEAPS